MNWLVENADWLWLAIGLLFLVMEMVIPGIYLLWVGLAAFLTGVFVFAMPDMAPLIQGLIFAVASVILILVSRRAMYGQVGQPPENDMNKGGDQLVGQTLIVVQAIENGRGKVKVRDSQWLATGPDAEVGDKVKVVSADGTLLTVEKA